MKLVGHVAKWLGIGVYAVCAVVVLMFLMPIGGWKALNVLTGSMRPTIQPGTLVLIHRVPLHDISAGDIVTYQDPANFQKTITHRVVKIAKIKGVTTVTVKGDANKKPDQPFAGGYIVGRVQAIVPGAGQYIGWLHSAWGLAALVIIPGLLVIWAEVRILRRSLAKAKAGETTAHEPQAPPDPPAPPARPTAAVTATAAHQRPRRNLDGMSSKIALSMAIVFVAAGGASAAVTEGKVTLKHNKFTAVDTSNHPQTIFDCLHNGWKKFGFKNQGQCIVYVIHHSQNPAPLPSPSPRPTHLPFPTHTPLPTIPPVFHQDTATPSPSPFPGPTPGSSPSPTPTH